MQASSRRVQTRWPRSLNTGNQTDQGQIVLGSDTLAQVFEHGVDHVENRAPTKGNDTVVSARWLKSMVCLCCTLWAHSFSFCQDVDQVDA